ncbi:MAG: CARDB domain-containing protein [Chloroflexota bacterium]
MIRRFILCVCFIATVFLPLAASATTPQSTISHITPTVGPNNIPVLVHIYGENFSANTQPVLSAPGDGPVPIIVKLLNVVVVDEGHLRAWVPAQIRAAVYDLSLLENDVVVDVLEDAYTAVSSDTADDLFVHDYEFWVSPPSGPQVGQTATIGVRVHRLGGFDSLTNVPVAFYEGDGITNPVSEGKFLGETVIETLEPNETAVATIDIIRQEAGRFRIHAVVDPENSTPETTQQNNIASRTLQVRPIGDNTTPSPPVVAINDGTPWTRDQKISIDLDLASGRQATSLTPRSLMYVEYIFIQSAQSWVPVRHSGWIPVAGNTADFQWQLNEQPGLHYMLVWTADAEGNISTTPGRQYINYAPETSSLLTDEGHLYRWLLEIGEQLHVRVTPLSGDPDLYVWNPDGTSAGTSQTADQVDEVIVTATQSGLHQIEVDGAAAGDYQLEITPLVQQTNTDLERFFGRPKGRIQPYFAPTEGPDDNTSLPTAPTHFVSLPIIRK